MPLGELEAHPRHQVIDNVAEAAEAAAGLGYGIGGGNGAIRREWDTSIWRGVMEGWQKARPNETELDGIITAMSATEIYDRHSAEVAYTLRRLLENNRNYIH